MTDRAYENCTLCPRRCGVDRRLSRGACGTGDTAALSRAALHFGEEPCLAGAGGSGAVFFSGCSLGCVYCQNRDISRGACGVPVSAERLSEILLSLEAAGAENIDLVTATHVVPTVRRALLLAKEAGLSLPVIYNTSAYERVETLSLLRGLVDIYLPDMKYHSSRLAALYSNAADYPRIAEEAIAYMAEETGAPRFSKDGRLLSGTLVRFLLLPEALIDCKAALHSIYRRHGNRVVYSLLSQYTPMGHSGFPALEKTVPRRDYVSLTRYAAALGIEHAYTQGEDAVGKGHIPLFDGTIV